MFEPHSLDPKAAVWLFFAVQSLALGPACVATLGEPPYAVLMEQLGRKTDSRGAESRFTRAIEAIDLVNARDPNELRFEGQSGPKELIHSRRVTHWVLELEPAASDLLLLAARAHHLRRWHLTRADYPAGRAGYHAWRRELQKRHAAEAAEILSQCDYEPEEISRVRDLICKRGLGRDREVQTLEDALCLVFLESQLESFSTQHSEEKVIDIIARSLSKLSVKGRLASTRIALHESTSAPVSAAMARLSSQET